MKRLLAPALIALAALTLAACGSDDSTSTPAAATANGTGAASSPAAIAKVVQVAGVGSALADASGQVLYMSDEEAADPNVSCSGACEAFWKPLTAGSADPAASSDVGDLGVVQRPDGTSQVTYRGHRLYTFTQDAPGQATGDGFSDTFDGQRFTWHVVVVDQPSTGASGGSGGDAPAPTPTTSAPAGYPGY
jgi:predicted lipoprotein with Yx(FWY)xxD motif